LDVPPLEKEENHLGNFVKVNLDYLEKLILDFPYEHSKQEEKNYLPKTLLDAVVSLEKL